MGPTDDRRGQPAAPDRSGRNPAFLQAWDALRAASGEPEQFAALSALLKTTPLSSPEPSAASFYEICFREARSRERKSGPQAEFVLETTFLDLARRASCANHPIQDPYAWTIGTIRDRMTGPDPERSRRRVPFEGLEALGQAPLELEADDPDPENREEMRNWVRDQEAQRWTLLSAAIDALPTGQRQAIREVLKEQKSAASAGQELSNAGAIKRVATRTEKKPASLKRQHCRAMQDLRTISSKPPFRRVSPPWPERPWSSP